jgi:plastocyanin
MRILGPKQLVAVGALALVLAACGGGDSEGSSYKEPTGPAVADVKLDTGNTFFKPNKVDVTPPGIIDVTLDNIESGIHDLVIRDLPGFQIEVSGEGDTVSKKVELEKGKYEFYCTIPGHEEAGMKGTLTVS